MCHTWEDEGSARFGLEEKLGVLKDILEERSKPGIAMVLSRNIHGVAHTLMNIDRSCRCSSHFLVMKCMHTLPSGQHAYRGTRRACTSIARVHNPREDQKLTRDSMKTQKVTNNYMQKFRCCHTSSLQLMMT